MMAPANVDDSQPSFFDKRTNFSSGQGNYTEERHTTQSQPPLEEILAAIREHREDTKAHYDEIIE